ncbi:MAG: RNA 2',3'-cyclic phosphodiesterase [Candidatus Delongbacteria bacterium]|nr:RNA 2',3'-cyclic phosphodiesterase [Candidatus Delongbacteria bacterium]
MEQKIRTFLALSFQTETRKRILEFLQGVQRPSVSPPSPPPAPELPVKRKVGRPPKNRPEVQPDPGETKTICESIKWVEPHNIHLTIKFWGDLLPSKVEELKERLPDWLQPDPISYLISGPGAYPSLVNPRVVWLGIQDKAEGLARLFRAVENLSHQLQIPLEAHPFSPHLTLGRIKNNNPPEDLTQRLQTQPWEPILEHVPEIVLYQSELRHEGPFYTPWLKIKVPIES